MWRSSWYRTILCPLMSLSHQAMNFDGLSLGYQIKTYPLRVSFWLQIMKLPGTLPWSQIRTSFSLIHQITPPFL
ncbi:hypothetical protein GQ44DRAFT_710972 [Phaeosphaeriaceae sp. PMI808]|nr:hypothetical protein GQ44DRAFT_710972 [Phaeosphaeriaceae sp. PMI808]